MKRDIRKLLAVVFSVVLCMGVLAGCLDIEEDVQATEEDNKIEMEVLQNGGADTVSGETGNNDVKEVEVSDGAGKSAGSPLCFSGTDVNGNPVNTADVFAKNKVTVVNLWASWCPACIGEIPELAKMNDEWKEKGCGVMGLLLDGNDPEGLSDAKNTLDQSGASYLNVICPAGLEDELEIVAYPSTFFVGSGGEILGDPIAGADSEGYRERVDQLLSDM